jgi:hypothetical protein
LDEDEATAFVLPDEYRAKGVFLATYLEEIQCVYLFCYMSAVSGFQRPNCKSGLFVSVYARVIRGMQVFYTPDQCDSNPTIINCSCRVWLNDKVKPKFAMEFLWKL